MCIHILQSVPLCSEKFYLLLFWSRLVHADLAMHATLAALRMTKFTHHDIVKQYRKGLTAVVDRCVYISYNLYHSVPKSFICCCSGRDSCMLTSRCMLPWLHSAPYPALCAPAPGDMQAVSYGARSRQYSPLLPASRSQPRSIVERRRSGPMCRVHIYTTMQAF